MTSLYLETSALLAWLFGEPRAKGIIRAIDKAEIVLSSVLTRVEAERALVRAENLKTISAKQTQELRGLLARVAAGFSYLEMTAEIRLRAGQPFPLEPVRSLDALHLATALVLAKVHPELQLLSLDERVQSNAQALGLEQARV